MEINIPIENADDKRDTLRELLSSAVMCCRLLTRDNIGILDDLAEEEDLALEISKKLVEEKHLETVQSILWRLWQSARNVLSDRSELNEPDKCREDSIAYKENTVRLLKKLQTIREIIEIWGDKNESRQYTDDLLGLLTVPCLYNRNKFSSGSPILAYILDYPGVQELVKQIPIEMKEYDDKKSREAITVASGSSAEGLGTPEKSITDIFVSALCSAVQERDSEALDLLFKAAPFPGVLTFPERVNYEGEIIERPGALFRTLQWVDFSLGTKAWVPPSPELFDQLCGMGADIHAEYKGFNCMDMLFAGGCGDYRERITILDYDDLPSGLDITPHCAEMVRRMTNRGLAPRLLPKYKITPYTCCLLANWENMAREELSFAHKNPERLLSQRTIFEAAFIKDMYLNAVAFYTEIVVFKTSDIAQNGFLSKEILNFALERNRQDIPSLLLRLFWKISQAGFRYIKEGDSNSEEIVNVRKTLDGAGLSSDEIDQVIDSLLYQVEKHYKEVFGDKYHEGMPLSIQDLPKTEQICVRAKQAFNSAKRVFSGKNTGARFIRKWQDEGRKAQEQFEKLSDFSRGK